MWHLKGDVKHTLAVPITPNSGLARACKESLKDTLAPDKGKTMVIEKGGRPFTAGIMMPDPFKPPRCRYDDANCMVDAGDDCMKSNVVYRIDCQKQACQDADAQSQTNDARQPEDASACTLRKTKYVG